jgi:hypothetical protein
LEEHRKALEYELTESCLERVICNYEKDIQGYCFIDVLYQKNELKSIFDTISYNLVIHKHVKVSFVAWCIYVKKNGLNQIEETTRLPLRTSAYKLVQSQNEKIRGSIKQMIRQLITRHEEVLLSGSNWIFVTLQRACLEFVKQASLFD